VAPPNADAADGLDVALSLARYLAVTTDYRDVLGELVHRRLGGGSLRHVFPDHRPRELGLARQR
jgi:hypothetical protein